MNGDCYPPVGASDTLPHSLARQAEAALAAAGVPAATDDLTRAAYATGACIYSVSPIGVVFPRHEGDVVRTVRLARQLGVSVTARGGGSGRNGAALNSGLITDFTRSMNRILEINVDAGWARVEPGVLLGQLNTALTPHGLFFPVDPSSARFCTFGGVFAQNSAGPHGLKYGVTADNAIGARLVLADGETMRSGMLADPQVRMIWTHGDTVGLQTRTALREAYQAEHRDLYGLQEFGQVAWECSAAPGTYHINEERVYVERDTDGALVMTNLINSAARIIRYRPGDRADVLDAPCPCGRGLRRLTGIQGRQRGFIVDRDGNPMNVKVLQCDLERQPLRRWQVTQDRPGVMTVALVPDTDTGAELDRAALAGTYRSLLNLDSVEMDVVRIEDLMTERGKAPLFRLFAAQDRYAADLCAGMSE